ncbi:hypothetical protein Tco_1329824, partial [Tanacetum coccineum]
MGENRADYDAEGEAIHLILTRIGDDIYSTVDACTTSKDMRIAIERLQQGELLNKQDVKTNCFRNLASLLQEMGSQLSHNTQVSLTTSTRMYQKEVNKIRAKKIARNTNPLALIAATQQYLDMYYQAPKSHKSYAPSTRTSSSNKSHATTKNKGKETAKLITPSFESASEEDSDPEQALRGKDMQKKLSTQAEKGLPFCVQSNDDYNVFANERHHSEQPESINDTYVVEKVNSNVIPNSS